MIIKRVDFGSVFGASGVEGFFGEGYPFHDPLRALGLLDFSGMTFTAKTMTLSMKEGNMPLRRNFKQLSGLVTTGRFSWGDLKPEDFRPKELFPGCIKVDLLRGLVINDVGLSNPGAEILLQSGHWQKRDDPFVLSFMSVAPTKETRLGELKLFVKILEQHLPFFNAPVMLQINVTCPNAGLCVEELVTEVNNLLDVAAPLNVALCPKLNLLVSSEAVKNISLHPRCDAICSSNSVPYGVEVEGINWGKIFKGKRSPLAHLGRGGGLSGKPLLKPLLKWLNSVMKLGVKKPIVAGGGILSPTDAIRVFNEGAAAIAIGSVAILRPWMVEEIIEDVNKWRF